MPADLGKAYVNIIPKAPGIESNIEGLLGGSEASAGVKKAGNGLGSKLMAGLKVGAVAAAVGLGKIIKDSFEAGGKLEQSFGGLDTIFEGAAVQAKAFALNAADMGISANTYAEQAVSMGAALKQAFGGDNVAAVQSANTAIMDMADNAAKMGTPIESLQAAYQGFAKGNYTMLDNLKLGYGGTKTEMERLLADAEKFSGVKYDIDNLGDVYEAIHVIQGELGLTGVAASEAKGTLQGSAGAMKASWENLMAALTTGEGLELAMQNMGESVSNFGSVVLKMGGKIAEQLPGVIQGLAKQAMAHAPEFIASGAEFMVKLAVGVVQGIPKVIQKLPDVFRRAKTAFAGYDWKSLGKEAIEGIAAGLKELASMIWDAMRQIAKDGWAAFKAWITGRGDTGGGGDGGGGGGTTKGFGYSAVDSAKYRAAMDTGWAPQKAAGTQMSQQDLEKALSGMTLAVDVILQGDAGQVFKVVRKTNAVFVRSTGRSPLTAGG